MKTIKDLTVKVTYTVGLSDVQVSDEVYEALEHLADLGETNCDHVDVDEHIGTPSRNSTDLLEGYGNLSEEELKTLLYVNPVLEGQAIEEKHMVDNIFNK